MDLDNLAGLALISFGYAISAVAVATAAYIVALICKEWRDY